MLRDAWPRIVFFLAIVTLISTAIIAQAAISGEFTSTYDADGSSEAPGKEIAVSGTIEVTGSSAVNPEIKVRSGDQTVLDQSSVTLKQEGSVDFETVYEKNQVVYRADEIPPGNTIELEFIVYPIGERDVTVDSSQVIVDYEVAGESDRETFETTTDLNGSEYATIQNLRDRVSEQNETISELESEVSSLNDTVDRLSIYRIVGIGAGALLVLIVVGFVIYKYRSGPPID